MDKRSNTSLNLYSLSAYTFYFLILSVLYNIYIAVFWGYYGFNSEFSYEKYFFSFIFFLIPLTIIPNNFSKPSTFFLILFTLVVYLPHLVFYCFGNGSFKLILLCLVALMFILFSSRTIRISLKINFTNQTSLYYFFIFFVYLVTANYLLNGVSFNLNVYDVYDFRDSQKDLFQNNFAFTLTNIQSKIIFPIAFIWSLVRKNYTIFFTLCLCLVVQFGYLNQKSNFFFPIISLGLFLTLSYSTKTNFFIAIFAILLLLFYFLLQLFDLDFFAHFLIRRTLFNGPINNEAYLVFFENNPFDYWSRSVLASFIDYPYGERIGDIIGSIRGTDGNAVTGIIGSGYSHAGVSGIIIYSIICGIILGYFDNISTSKTSKIFIISIIAPSFFSLYTNIDLATSFFTHGLLILLVFSALIKYE